MDERKLSLTVQLAPALPSDRAFTGYTVEEVVADMRKHLLQALANGYRITGFGPSGDYFKDHSHV